MKKFQEYLIEQDNESMAAGALFQAMDTRRICIALRSKLCDMPNTWSPVGGSAQDNENSIEAVIREVREEIGITITPEMLELLDTFRKPNFCYYTFLCRVPGEEYLAGHKLNEENTALSWFSLEVMPGKLHPGFAKTLSKAEVKRKLSS